MNKFKNIRTLFIFTVVVAIASCTKLDQKLNSSLTNTQAANTLGAAFVLQTAYNDIGNPFSDHGNIFALEEVSTDECVVPTRGGDWDDNGKWRDLHQHKWTVDGVDVILNQFNALNKINFDATNVMTPSFNATQEQAAQARFIRALALYQLLDLYGQFPYRDPGENLLNAPKVYTGDSAINFIISELTTILPQLNAANTITQANQDAVKFLLMRCYLNKGAFLNRPSPTFADADMQKVITLGNEIIASGKYTFNTNYFDNFDATNSGTKEGIFAFPNTSGVSINNSGINNRWMSSLHYNQYTALNPQAGWNGFSTVAEFYNTFGVTTPATLTPIDTLLDYRIGGRFYRGSTDVSGLRPGLLVGQQYNEKGEPIRDRKGNLLIFDPRIDPTLKETGNNLEITGIRVVKYVPDYSNNGANYNSASGNWLMLFRYPDVKLMVAEAKMRAAAPDNAGALAIVNEIRSVRGASMLSAITLVNTANVYDPTTLLAERGREMYWEGVRRTDLIRFGVFTKAWAYKPESSSRYLVYPIPTQALAANPNLRQNAGY